MRHRGRSGTHGGSPWNRRAGRTLASIGRHTDPADLRHGRKPGGFFMSGRLSTAALRGVSSSCPGSRMAIQQHGHSHRDSRGAIVEAWSTLGSMPVFAVNPKQTDRFRDRHTAAGARDDSRDASRTLPQRTRRVSDEWSWTIRLSSSSASCRARTTICGTDGRQNGSANSCILRLSPPADSRAGPSAPAAFRPGFRLPARRLSCRTCDRALDAPRV